MSIAQRFPIFAVFGSTFCSLQFFRLFRFDVEPFITTTKSEILQDENRLSRHASNSAALLDKLKPFPLSSFDSFTPSREKKNRDKRETENICLSLHNFHWTFDSCCCAQRFDLRRLCVLRLPIVCLKFEINENDKRIESEQTRKNSKETTNKTMRKMHWNISNWIRWATELLRSRLIDGENEMKSQKTNETRTEAINCIVCFHKKKRQFQLLKNGKKDEAKRTPRIELVANGMRKFFVCLKYTKLQRNEEEKHWTKSMNANVPRNVPLNVKWKQEKFYWNASQSLKRFNCILHLTEPNKQDEEEIKSAKSKFACKFFAS